MFQTSLYEAVDLFMDAETIQQMYIFRLSVYKENNKITVMVCMDMINLEYLKYENRTEGK